MILIAVFALAVATVPLCGGRFQRLATVSMRWTSLLFVALAMQIALTEILPASLPGLAAFHMLSYVAAFGFLWANRRISGMWLVFAGAGANTIAIGLNGGVMPASAHALRVAGITSSAHFDNSAAVANAHAAWLGDVFAIPKGWPLANVFSVGDVLLVLGGALVLHALCGSRLVAGRFAGVGSADSVDVVDAVDATRTLVPCGLSISPPLHDAWQQALARRGA